MIELDRLLPRIDFQAAVGCAVLQQVNVDRVSRC